MDLSRIADGLWQWTTAHPEWKEGDDWDRDVGCVYWEADDTVVLVDPLVPIDQPERARFLDALDRDVERVGRPVAVLLTCEWHARSADELRGRYEARVFRPLDREERPAGVSAIEAPVAEEVVYWLAGARAVVPGDTLIGTAGGVALCPASWLEGRGGLQQLADDLSPLLELPVERVLTSHGPPVLADGRAALGRALAAQPPA
jgi:glyoxylase-like metal-dependent hydrolase (beta-lactamase superfamily II)